MKNSQLHARTASSFQIPRWMSSRLPARAWLGCWLALLGSAVASGAAPGGQLWQFHAEGGFVATPALGPDGTVYAACVDRNLYALEGATGARKWAFQAANPLYAAPALGLDGTLFLGESQYCYAVDSATGALKWRRPIKCYAAPAIGSDGMVYIASTYAAGNGASYQRMYALDGATGEPRWEFTGKTVSASVALPSPSLGRDGTVYYGGFDRALYALDGRTGRLKWEYPLEGEALASPAVGGEPETVFTSGSDFSFYAIDAVTGGKKWEFNTTSDTVAASPIVGPDGTIYARTVTGMIYALAADSGTVKWKFQTEFNDRSTPALGANGTLYACGLDRSGTREEKLHAIKADTGREEWSFSGGSGIDPLLLGAFYDHSPTLGTNGTIYWGTYGGDVFALQSGSASGLAESAWPKLHGEVRNSGQCRSEVRIEGTLDRWSVGTLAGSGQAGDAIGVGTNAAFRSPAGVSAGTNGWVYLADTFNHRVLRVGATGEVNLLAGTGVAGHRDGAAAESQFNGPAGVCVEPSGRLYVTETNQYVRFVEVDGQVGTLAGTGMAGYADGPGPAAQFNGPHGVAVDATGVLYVVDTQNHAVRRVTREGMVSTWVGNGAPGDTDGPRAQARLNQPAGIALDPAGVIYISEACGRIRALMPDGQVKTLAGAATAGYVDGPAAEARFNQPDGLGVDGLGRLWVADAGNHVLRRFLPGGRVETVVGSGAAGYREDFGHEARFNHPQGLCLDTNGAVYVADTFNHALRQAILVNTPPTIDPMADQTIIETGTGSVTIPYHDSDQPSQGMRFSLVLEAPEWMGIYKTIWQWPYMTPYGEVVPSGVLWYQPPLLPASVTNWVVVKVEDSAGGATMRSFQLTVLIHEAHAPVLAEIPDQVIVAGHTLRLTVTATDADVPAQPLTYQLDPGSPEGMTLDPKSGLLVWAVDDEQVGAHSVPLRVTDFHGSTGTRSFNVVVQPSPSGPILPERAMEQLWTYATGGAISNSPAVGDDGTVYASAADGTVYAVNGDTGTERWRFAAGGVLSTPVIGPGGAVYVLADGTRLYALNALTGARTWESALQPGADGPPLVGADGRLYVGQVTNIAAIDPTTGQPGAGLPLAGVPQAIAVDGTLLASSAIAGAYLDVGFKLSAIHTVTGKTNWEVTGPELRAGVAIGPQDFLFQVVATPVDILPKVRAVDLQTGLVKWSSLIDTSRGFSIEWHNPQTSQPVVAADGSVYLASSDVNRGFTREYYTEASVFAFSGATGKLKWKSVLANFYHFRLSSQPLDTNQFRVSGTPAVGPNGTVYAVADFDGTGMLYALDGGSGQIKFKLPTVEPLSSLALRADGRIYAGSSSGKLYAIAGCAAGGLAPSPWPKQYGHAHNTRNVAEPAAAPVLADIADQTIEAYRKWTLPVSLVNASALLQPVSYFFEGSVPKGMGIDTNTGVITWRPAQDQTPSTNRIVVRVSQVNGAGDVKAFTLVVTDTPGLLRWQSAVGAAVTTCPALGDDGTLYVVSADSQAHALEALTGASKWSFSWPQPASGAQVWPPVIGDEGLVYVGSPTTLYALDPATGIKRWEFSGRSRWTGAPLVGTDGLLYLGGSDGWVYGLDRLTGELRRLFSGAGVPGFIDRFGTLYTATDTQVFAFDTASGARLWSAQPMADLTASTTASSRPVMGADDTLLVANANSREGFSYVAEGNVSALDRLTGRRQWSHSTSYDWLGVNATPIVGPDARVYSGTHAYGSPYGGVISFTWDSWNASTMAVLDGTTGNPLTEIEVIRYSIPYMGHSGQTPPSGLVNTPPAITQDNLLFVGSYNSDAEVMNALDTTTGQKIWAWPAGQSASPPAVGPDGTVYFGDDLGRVHALRSGAVMGLATHAWPKFMGDAHNSGRAPGVVVSNTLVLSVPRSRTLHTGDVLTAVVAATNPALPAARYTYTLVSAPAGMTLNPVDGTLAWTPIAVQAFTTNWVSVLATDDGQPATGKAEAFVVIVLGDKWTLPLAAPVEVTVRPLNTLYFSVHAANPDWPLEAPMYRLAPGAPAGMVLDTGGRITWTPGVADADRTNRVTVSVQNAHGGEGEATVSVIVTPAGQERLPGEVVWTFPMQSATASSPAIGTDGTVYVGSGASDKKVFALDGTTGAEKWEFPTGDSVPYAVAVGVDGTVYAVSADQRLYALDGATGHKRWEFSNGTPLVADPVVGRDGKVYIYSHGVLPSQGVLALDGQSGSPVWAQPVWRMVPYLPVAIAPDGTLCCSGFLLFGADTANGVIKWASSIVGAQIVQTSPSVVYWQPRVAVGSNGVLYAAADQLCALDAATGTVKWQRPGTTDPPGATNSPYTGYGSLILGPKGVLFVAANVPSPSPMEQPRGKLVAMEAGTGATLWESAETPMITSTPAIGDDGTIYAGTADGVYYAFNSTNGIIQWGMSTLKTSDKMWVSSPNIGAQGLVYFMGAGSNAVFAVKGSGSGGLARSDWPRFHGDARNSGNVATETIAPSLAFADMPLQTVAEQTLFSLNLVATNAAGSSNTLQYSLLDAPEGMVIEAASGALRWNPTEAQGPSTNRVVAKVVQDGYPSLSATNQFTVVVTEVNLAPVLTVPADQTIDPLASWTATLTAADPDVPANALAFALGSGPAGLTLDPLTGIIRWTPAPAQASSVNQITVRVTDNGVPPLSAERSFTLTVKAVDLPPQLTTTPRAYTVTAGATLVFTNTAVDPNQPAKPFVFLLDLDQPAGATLDRDTGVFTWTAATAPATNQFTIWVTETVAPFARASQPFTVVTLPAPPVIRISGVTRDDASHLTVHWTSLPAWRYQLEYKPRLDGSPWTPVGNPVTATAASSSQTDSQANDAQRFYRVVQVL